ncbi:MAG: glucose 1-dehydrogenase [Novosphingobium sp.]|nr:glucose 1-dehydrogenase [Novosphingobium sp.]
MVDLAGKVAIVTGGSKGIGAEIAFRLADAGAAVAVNYASDREGAERVVERIGAAGGRAVALGADVSSESDVQGLVAQAVAAFGRLDIVVNNAAYFSFGPVEAISVDDYRRHFDVNVLGAILLTREASPHLTEGGSIINIGSAGVLNPMPNALLYAGSKAALERITRFLAKELGPRQIRVNMVLPGATDTEGNRRIGTLDNEAAVKALIEHTALRRFGHPEDVAPAVVFLASDEAAWITGTMLEASGGFS